MGIVRGMARTAVVAGTATAVSHRVSRRMNRRDAEAAALQEQQMGAAAPQYAEPAPQADLTTQLRELNDLKAQGILTEAEFQAAKKKLM